MTDKAFEEQVEYLNDEPQRDPLTDEQQYLEVNRPVMDPYPLVKSPWGSLSDGELRWPSAPYLPPNTHDPETGVELPLTGQAVNHLREVAEQVQNGEVPPQRAALAKNRMQNVAALLAERRANFMGYLKIRNIPYVRTENRDGKKAILILLEDIMESDLERETE